MKSSLALTLLLTVAFVIGCGGKKYDKSTLPETMGPPKTKSEGKKNAKQGGPGGKKAPLDVKGDKKDTTKKITGKKTDKKDAKKTGKKDAKNKK